MRNVHYVDRWTTVQQFTDMFDTKLRRDIACEMYGKKHMRTLTDRVYLRFANRLTEQGIGLF